MPVRTRRLLLATAALTTVLGACEHRPFTHESLRPATPDDVSQTATPDAAVSATPDASPGQAALVAPDASVAPSDVAIEIKNVPDIDIKAIYANTKGSHYDNGYTKQHEKSSTKIVPSRS